MAKRRSQKSSYCPIQPKQIPADRPSWPVSRLDRPLVYRFGTTPQQCQRHAPMRLCALWSAGLKHIRSIHLLGLSQTLVHLPQRVFSHILASSPDRSPLAHIQQSQMKLSSLNFCGSGQLPSSRSAIARYLSGASIPRRLSLFFRTFASVLPIRRHLQTP
jgi:hypothetical protein